MTIAEIVKLLEKEGHSVKYYVRKDGGLLITEIDGVKYKGASGNAQARAMSGQVVSERRVQQLKKITKQRKVKHKKLKIPDELEKMRKKVERAWRKAGIKGQISKRNLEAIIKERGVAGAKTYLEEMMRHTKGYAYTTQIDDLIMRIQQDMVVSDEKENTWLEKVIQLIEANRETLLVEVLFSIFDKLYEFEQFRLSAHDFYLFVKSAIK